LEKRLEIVAFAQVYLQAVWDAHKFGLGMEICWMREMGIVEMNQIFIERNWRCIPYAPPLSVIKINNGI